MEKNNYQVTPIRVFVLLYLAINLMFFSARLNAQNYTLDFSGGNDYVSISSNFGLSASGPRTIECWVYIPSTSEKGTFVNIGNSVNGYAIGVGGTTFDDNGNQLIFINNMIAWHGTGDNIGTGWHHVAFTVDASYNTTVYLDGYGVDSFTQTPYAPSNTSFIGSTDISNRCLSNGKIDEVRIWNVVRTQAEICANMYKEVSTGSNLAGYYKMSDGSGTTLTDNSGNSHNGGITGAAWQASGVFAGPRNALDFNGTDENVTIPHNSTLDLSYVTLTAWINADTWKTNYYDGTIIVKEYGTSGYGLRCGQGGMLNFFVYLGGTVYQVTSAALMSTGKWHHVAGVYDGSAVTIYIDGVSVGSAAATGTLSTYSVQVYIGGYGGRWFDGKIDECQLWSTALTESQIRENMMTTRAGNETGLKAYYRMDYATGTTLYDVTSNANNGTLNNMETANWVSSSAFNTWIGGESGTWSTVANWSRNSVPSSTDNIGLYKYTLGNEVTLSGTPTVNNLYFSSTASPTLSSNFTVNGNLILGKNTGLNGRQITIGSSGKLVEGSYTFSGTTGSITTTRSLSNISAENVGGLGATITTSSNMGSTTITRSHAAQTGNSNTGILRYFDITPTTNTGLNATLVFNYLDGELNGKTEANLKLFKSTDAGNAWSYQGGTIDAANNKVTLSGIDGFSRWTAADMNAPLVPFAPQHGAYALKFANSPVSVSSFSGITSAHTAECWVYLPGTSEKGPFITIYYNSELQVSIGVGGTSIFNTGNQLILRYGGSMYQTGDNIGTGWHHVAFSVDVSNNLIVYLDGKSVDTRTLLSSPGSSYAMDLGRLSAGASYYLSNATLDEVRIWNTVRSEAEIKANMHREIAVNANLKGYYTMSDGSGTTLTDNSGNGQSGTITNASWVASGCFSGPRNALNFGGVDDYVDIPESASLNNASFTVEFWVSLAQATLTYNGIIDKGRDTGNDWYFLSYTSASPGTLIFGYNGWEAYAGLGLNTWNHIAGVYDGTNFKLYQNGRLIAAYAKAYTPTINNVSIGSRRGGINPFYGKLDEVRIWSTARTAEEIRESMANTLAGNETGLKAYYRFDYTDGTTLYDLTSNANNGTLTNMDPATAWVTSSAFNTWIGCESSAWSTAGNWSRNAAPSSTDNTGLYKYTGGSETTIDGTPAVNHLVFTSAATPTLNSSFTVNGNIVLNKNLNQTDKVITLGSSGYLIEGSYRLSGTTGTITTTRSLSNLNAENVGGLGATITTSANMGSTTITRGYTAQSGSGYTGILRYYDITPATTSSLNATLVFSYHTDELNGKPEANLKLFKSTNTGTNWSYQGGTVNPVNKTVTLSGIGDFLARWTTADGETPLPVLVGSFSVSINGNSVTLGWETNSESGNHGFEVERKNEESEWTKLGFVKGNGTVYTQSKYSFEDGKLSSGKYQYRLKQIDHNGNFEYHNLNGIVEIGIPAKYDLGQNYPNPFNPSTKIDFKIPRDSKVTFKIFDATGRQVAAPINNEFRRADYYTFEFTPCGFASGIYFYRLETVDSKGFNAITKKMAFLK